VHIQRLTTNNVLTRGQSGQTNAELALITSLIALVLIGVALTVGSQLSDAYQAVSDTIAGLI
jgi:Flp pilus assembly pilin Flp